MAILVPFRKNGGLDSATEIEIRVVDTTPKAFALGGNSSSILGVIGTLTRQQFNDAGQDIGIKKLFQNDVSSENPVANAGRTFARHFA